MQAAERADEAAALAAVSAAVLYPPALASPGGSVGGLYNARALQCWVLRACQQLKGGLRDKPGKPPDYYHSCYCLSGLSSAQHLPGAIAAEAALTGWVPRCPCGRRQSSTVPAIPRRRLQAVVAC